MCVREINLLLLLLLHAFGDHTECKTSWCGYKRDLNNYKHKSLPHGKDLFGESLKMHLIIYLVTTVRRLWLPKLHHVQIHKEIKPLTVWSDKKIQKLDFMVAVTATIFELHVLLPKEIFDILTWTEHWRHSILNLVHFPQITMRG